MKSKDKIKIIHLISSLKRGGRERQLATIINNTDQNKYPSKIIYFNSAEIDYIDEYNLPDLVIKIQSKKFRSRLIELNSILKKEKPDIVYTWGNLESIFILLLHKLHTFKFINGSVRHGIRSRKFSHYFRTFVLHLSQNIVANSYAGLKANSLKRGNVLYNGIDNKFIHRLSYDDKLKLRKPILDLDNNKLLFISVANLVPYKDYFSILTALKQLKVDGQIFYYLILGDGPLRNKIEEKIDEYNLMNEIRIFGNVPNVNEYLKISDIFIHSSKGEGCSNAILEAMAAGLPIVASNTGGTSEIVTAENGILFEYKNVIELKTALTKLIYDKQTTQKFGKRSHKIVREKFSIEQMSSNYIKIIETTINE